MSEPCGQRIARGHWAEDAALRRCWFPIGPRNTWSNLAYLAAGVYLLQRPTQSHLAMGLALVVLGVGSGLYHGFKTLWANNLDWFGMYMAMGTLVLHGLLPNAPGFAFGAVWMTAMAAALFAFAERHFDSHMAVLFVTALGATVFKGNIALAFLATLLFALGYAAWQADQARLLKLWGHALWHGLTAGAMVALFLAQAG